MRAQFDADEVRGYYQYERHVAHLRDRKDAEIRDLRQRETEELGKLEAATRSRRVAEKLHVRRHAAYRAHRRHMEQKILDETATLYAARNAEPEPETEPKRIEMAKLILFACVGVISLPPPSRSSSCGAGIPFRTPFSR